MLMWIYRVLVVRFAKLHHVRHVCKSLYLPPNVQILMRLPMPYEQAMYKEKKGI
jgi:hypothetical protein